ncbi:superfamily II DNA/RNA helicase [Nocardia transvalensis]|uniref:Superfamily II DNA/RNA helicase n=1 Tax=Nocardia transvalensis TaxID=37333 RepID=A0A7W9PJW6_9NOCA|nr:superfamily II DNA/RNA helicase [Nocardia transvalensis]
MNTTTTFAALGVREPLVRALDRAGITAPFPIQADTLPDTLAGRDVLGRGRTGSGKTLAFSIPTVARLSGELAGRRRPNRPLGLILAPTRELATQIATALEPLTAAYSMKVTTIFGGVTQHRQVRALREGVDIVVACPGRLEDLMGQGLVSLDAVEITVIDEADHMADLGFLPGVTRILAATPADGQRLLFSATLDNGVDKLVRRFLPDAVLHSVDEATSPVAAMTHHVFEVGSPSVKNDLVHKLAAGTGRRILFMRTKHQARRLAKTLTTAGIPAVDLHGNLAQPARDRNLAAFASGAARVLVATDVAARGVHVDDVELVVHVDPPAEHKAYLHRSGRTARAGSTGDVVTLVLPDQRKDMAALMRRAAISVRPQRVTADSAAVSDLVGEIAPLVTAAPPAPQQPSGRQRAGDNASGRGRASGTPRNGRGRAAAGNGRGHAVADSGRGRAPGENGRGGSAVKSGRGAASQGGSGRSDHAGDFAGSGAKGGRGRRAADAPVRGRGGNAPAGRGRGEKAGGGSPAGGRRNASAGAGTQDGGGHRGGNRGTGRGAAPAGSTGGVAGFSRAGGGRRRG